jgi:uncharacterized membrane protein
MFSLEGLAAMKRTTREWVRKAESDFQLATVIARGTEPFPNQQCFRRGLTFLTRFASETRYPGDNASKRQAASALRWAGKVRQACRHLLGL